MQNINDQIRAYIKHLRIAHNLTQTQLADKILVHRKTYSNYETGHTEIPLNIFIRILTVYGIELQIKEGINDKHT